MKGITNIHHINAITAAQDIIIALVMDACTDIGDIERSAEAEQNLRRSKKELDAALKLLYAKS